MSSPLEHAIDNMSGTDLEKLAPEILKEQGYNVKASGEHGTDGGWDAFIDISNKEGVAHASKQKRWRQKLRSDADNAAELEEMDDFDFDIFVFITNQQPTGQQELDLRTEIGDDHGWDLIILHRRDLISTLGTDRPDLAERILGVDIRKRRENLENLKEIVERRNEKIKCGDGISSELDSGPFAVLHLLPNGMTTMNYADTFDNLPSPPAFDPNIPGKTKTTGRAKYTVDARFSEDTAKKYGFIRMDGLFEAVNTDLFYPPVTKESEEEGIITNRSDGQGLDTKLCQCLASGMQNLSQTGVSGPVFFFFSLLNAEGYSMTHKRNAGPLSTFKSDNYTTSPVTIGSLQTDATEIAMRPLDEIWRELGRADGSPNYEDGTWTGTDVSL